MVATLLLDELLHGLLADAVIAEVIELLKFVRKLAVLHARVDLRYQVLEGLVHIRRIQRTRLHKFYLCTSEHESGRFKPKFTYIVAGQSARLRRE